MSPTAETDQPTPPRRRRLLWTLLGTMLLVGLLPLIVSHYFLIGTRFDRKWIKYLFITLDN